MSLKKGLKRIAILLLIVACLHVFYVTVATILYSQKDETIEADAAIVLGASIWMYGPSPVFEERINHAIWLYQEGYVHKIIFTGGKVSEDATSDSSIAKAYAIKQGVPEEDIYIEEESKTTEENILYAAQIVQEQGFDRVLLVSDPLHMRRAMLMAEDSGLDVFSSPTPTTKYKTLKTQIPFLAHEVVYYIFYEAYHMFGIIVISC